MEGSLDVTRIVYNNRILLILCHYLSGSYAENNLRQYARDAANHGLLRPESCKGEHQRPGKFQIQVNYTG